MEINLKDKVCLVMDYGSYLPLASRLARSDGFGTVYYHIPVVHNGYPDHRPHDIGRNVEGVIKIDEWASVINEVDIVVFPDVYEPALQTYFASIGKAVFGSRYACELEYNRGKLKSMMKKLGLPVNEYEIVTGVDELDRSLKDKTNVFVKGNLRGDMESWKSTEYILSKGELQRMRTHLGAFQNKAVFLIETPVESLAEVGIDTFCIGGRYPYDTLTGIELKDIGYYGQIVPYKSLPKQLRLVTDKFSDLFSDLEYYGAHSNEVIISDDNKGYCIDLTNRFPQPPSDLMMEMYTNFPEIVWDVANKKIPELQYKYKHGVQFIIKSDLAKTEASPLIVPEEYKNFVKIKNLTIDDDGTWYYTPLSIEMTEIGSVVGVGNSLKEAVKMASKIVESIKGFDIKINTDCIEDAEDQISKLHENGIKYL